MIGVLIKRGNLDTDMDTEKKTVLNGEISLEKNQKK